MLMLKINEKKEKNLYDNYRFEFIKMNKCASYNRRFVLSIFVVY